MDRNRGALRPRARLRRKRRWLGSYRTKTSAEDAASRRSPAPSLIARIIYKRAHTYVKVDRILSTVGPAIRRPPMTRPKTISNEEILAAARAIFRKSGHAAPTREIAIAAGI